MCGGPIFRKGPDLFLNTAKYINDKFNNENIKFIWQGGFKNSSSFHDFLNEINRLNLNNIIEVCPTTIDVQPFFDKINVFFCSSREEPFGMVILEAGLNRIPSLAFQQTGGPEEILSSNRGVLVPYGDFNKMALAIIELKNNNSLYTKYSNNLYEYSIKNFNQNNNLEIIKEINKLTS